MSQQIDPQILGEAADWMVQLQSGVATEEDHRAVQNWRNRSPQHAQAWQRAEAILGDFRNLPGAIATETFKRVNHNKGIGRRQALTRLGLLLLAGPSAWMAWQHTSLRQWTADQHTAVGEQKSLTLPDGTRVLLNTASSLNIAFGPEERRLQLLTGEILITTAKDSARPFFVQTEHGTAQALGTRFSVRIDGERSLVAVQEGSVRMQPNTGQSLLIQAGEQSAFSASTVMPVTSLDAAALTWENGMLLARDMRLADLIDELGRYRSGVLRCHPAVANLRVSGAFPLRDTDASLRLLHDSLPVTVSSLTRYWVAIEPR
ncbi:FecR domain-containing protein [Pseudomonas sp. NPDC089734]|uniref:FecR domain-containing protein n=1 Tax=Pseudomonas sp. NPDC089734 TaxID=3364469 RepID=UPI003814696C